MAREDNEGLTDPEKTACEPQSPVNALRGATLIADEATRLPARPGVYRMMNEAGDVLYVGKAKSLRNRVSSYAKSGGHSNRIMRMIAETRKMEFVVTATETEALLLEANLIKQLKPRYNVILRDDKSFPYILIAEDHEAPQILKHRGARKRKGAYYGPFASAMAVNKTLNTLQKAFLRSPLKFSAPITSRFSRNRFHPVLKYHRPHLGVDYGAPYGAPVQSIGEGRVLFAGRRGGNGNFVHIRHSNGYETMYLHLSRILVRAGQRVSQGQLIGRVGATGLASGPHLDFRITQNGAFRNFAALNLPPAEPVARSLRPEFDTTRDEAMSLLSKDPTKKM